VRGKAWDYPPWAQSVARRSSDRQDFDLKLYSDFALTQILGPLPAEPFGPTGHRCAGRKVVSTPEGTVCPDRGRLPCKPDIGFQWTDIGVIASSGAAGLLIAATYFSWKPAGE